MKRFFASAMVLMLLLACALPAQAKKATGVDMGKYTCGDLMKEKADDIGLVIMWIDGYISSETGDLKMDQAWIEELAQTISDECQKNSNKKIIDIAHEIVEASN